MVDALREMHRALAPGGTLLDLRPVSANNPVELVAGDRVRPLPPISAWGRVAEDRAADNAVQFAVAAGWFLPERDRRFDFACYFDTVDEMRTLVAESHRMTSVPDYEDIETRRREMAQTGTSVRIRCRRRMMLASYRKGTSAT